MGLDNLVIECILTHVAQERSDCVIVAMCHGQMERCQPVTRLRVCLS